LRLCVTAWSSVDASFSSLAIDATRSIEGGRVDRSPSSSYSSSQHSSTQKPIEKTVLASIDRARIVGRRRTSRRRSRVRTVGFAPRRAPTRPRAALKEACSAVNRKAQFAFKDLMIH